LNYAARIQFGSLTLLRSHHELWRLTTIPVFLLIFPTNVFSVLGAVRHLSLQLESGNDRNLVDDRRHRDRSHFRRPDRSHGHNASARKRNPFYIGQFFGRKRDDHLPGWLKTGAWLAGFNPNHLALEYFHAGGPKHDDLTPRSASENKVELQAPCKVCDQSLFNHRNPGCFFSSEFLGGLLIPKIGFTCREAPYFPRPAVCLFTANAHGNPD